MKLLSVAALTVLHAVAQGTSHGFDIIDGTNLPGGTVYPALSRLERDGLVASSWEPAADARREGGRHGATTPSPASAWRR